jgi:RimJ/RimL family protein N-acetyltransferase
VRRRSADPAKVGDPVLDELKQAPAHVDGDGVGLRRWTPEDADDLLRWWSRPDIAISAGIDLPIPPEKVRLELAAHGLAWAFGYALHYAVHTVDDAAVGGVDLRVRDAGQRVAEVGWWTAPEHRRRGFAVAGVKLLRDLAHHQLAIRTLEAKIVITNTASRSVADQAGFSLAGPTDSETGCRPGETRIRYVHSA